MATVDGDGGQGIGERIERARLDAGLTRDELAALAGVSPRALQGWISGEHVPRGISLAKLERGLGVSLDAVQPAIEDRELRWQDVLDQLRRAAREMDFARAMVRQIADQELARASGE